VGSVHQRRWTLKSQVRSGIGFWRANADFPGFAGILGQNVLKRLILL